MFLGIIALIKFFMVEQIPPLPKPAQNKEKEVAYDYEKLAKMQEIFLEQARKNPDVKLIDLDEAVKGIGGEGEKKILEKASLDYKDARHQMLKLWEDGDFEKIGHDARGDIMNGEKLYEILTGALPQARVDVQFLPFAVYVRCDTSVDFGFLYGTVASGGESSLESRFHEVKERQEKASGVATHFQYAYPDTNIPLIVENSEIYRNKPEKYIEKARDSLIVHEEQHVINNFFTDALFFDKLSADNSLLEAVGEKLKREMQGEKFGMEDVRENLAIYTEKLKKQFLRNAQNEIVAYLREGRAPQEIAGFLKRRGSLYDYFGQERDRFAAEFRMFFGDYAEEFLLFVQAEFYKNYEQDIKTAAALCEILLTKYSAEEIVPYLNVAPIWKWEEVKQKMMEAKL